MHQSLQDAYLARLLPVLRLQYGLRLGHKVACSDTMVLMREACARADAR